MPCSAAGGLILPLLLVGLIINSINTNDDNDDDDDDDNYDDHHDHHDFDDCDDHDTNGSRGSLILEDMQAVGVKEGEGGGQEGILIVLLLWSRTIL